MRRLLSLPPDLIAGGAGAIGGVATLAATFGFGLPLWIAALTAGVGYAGMRLALTQVPAEPFDPARLTLASDDLAREVIAEARIEARRLLASATAVREPFVRAHLMNLYALGSKVAGEVERDPQRLGSVRRLLTYYIPAAARLAEGFQALETARFPDGARLASTQTMIARLHETCARQADRLNETDVDGLDVEMKLLDDAIRADDRDHLRGLPPLPKAPDIPRLAAGDPPAPQSAAEQTRQPGFLP